MNECRTIAIGEILICIYCHHPVEERLRQSRYRDFVAEGRPDIVLDMHDGLPKLKYTDKIFECPPIWSLHQQGKVTAVEVYRDPTFPESAAKVCTFSYPLKRADLYVSEDAPAWSGIITGPTMELLFISYLAQGKGLIVHGCGIDFSGNGLLFVGDSGAGKSTLAKLWNRYSNSDCILSDDRIIVRYVDDDFWIHGTPWHGDATFASPQKTQLKKVFFLQHGDANSFSDVSKLRAVSDLTKSSFLPHWDPGGMTFSLSVLEELVNTIPCQQLMFRPDKNAVDFIQGGVG